MFCQEREELRREFERDIRPVVESRMKKRAVLSFLLGSVRDSYTAKQIDREYRAHGDIFQVQKVLPFNTGNF